MRKGEILFLVALVALQFGGLTPKSAAKAASKSAAMVELEPGVYFYETSYCDSSGGVPTRLWVYLPKNRTGDIPCVVIAPAGTRLFHGSDHGDGERPEHLPYVRKGMAVIAYNIDGPLGDDESDAQVTAAASKFRNADGGILNAQSAISYASRLKGIDASRIIVAGHSSAGTLALQVAEHNPKVKACIAYAPATDVVKRVGLIALGFESKMPGFSGFIGDISPITHTADLKCPTFIFHADDDENVTAGSLKPFITKLKKTNNSVTYMQVLSGGHYDSMVTQGIPAAIEWLGRLNLVAPKVSAPKPAPVPAASAQPAATTGSRNHR